MDGYNLVLGVLGAVLWAGVLVRWYTGATFGRFAAAALVVAMAAVNVIVVFGSLRLLNVLGDDAWEVVGTGGRVVFDLAAIVALLDSHGATQPGVG